MKLVRLAVIGMIIAMFVIHLPSAYADEKTDDFFRSIFGSSGGKLTDSKIIRGLKEALEIGTGNAVDIVSKLNGYYKNPNILLKAFRSKNSLQTELGFTVLNSLLAGFSFLKRIKTFKYRYYR